MQKKNKSLIRAFRILTVKVKWQFEKKKKSVKAKSIGGVPGLLGARIHINLKTLLLGL